MVLHKATTTRHQKKSIHLQAILIKGWCNYLVEIEMYTSYSVFFLPCKCIRMHTSDVQAELKTIKTEPLGYLKATSLDKNINYLKIQGISIGPTLIFILTAWILVWLCFLNSVHQLFHFFINTTCFWRNILMFFYESKCLFSLFSFVTVYAFDK